jgi:hypothetical protein
LLLGARGLLQFTHIRTGVHGDRSSPWVVERGPGGQHTYRRGAAISLVARRTSGVVSVPVMVSTRTLATLPTAAPTTTSLTLSLAASAREARGGRWLGVVGVECLRWC